MYTASNQTEDETDTPDELSSPEPPADIGGLSDEYYRPKLVHTGKSCVRLSYTFPPK